MNNSTINKRRGVTQSQQLSQSGKNHKRTQSQGNALHSRYHHIPSENLKFQQFIDLIFESRMQKEDIKYEIINYVQALETNYNDTIREQK
jgi:hypothetical protein